MRRLDSMACADASAIWDHAEILAPVVPAGPPNLITIGFKWVMVKTPLHTHVDPWAGRPALVLGV